MLWSAANKDGADGSMIIAVDKGYLDRAVAALVLTLTLSQVNLDAATRYLRPGETKNDEACTVYVTEQLRALLSERVERVKALSRTLGLLVPFLFPHLRGCYKGQQRRTFYKVWKDACN